MVNYISLPNPAKALNLRPSDWVGTLDDLRHYAVAQRQARRAAPGFRSPARRRELMFLAEMYNIFLKTRSPPGIVRRSIRGLWQQVILQQTNANLGRFTAAANPAVSFSLRVQF